jgi:pimeloyl-ACP methyl ester carboxylesterase
VVCGHSYGGAVVTLGAAEHPNARHLVYLAAFMLDAGESVRRSMPSTYVVCTEDCAVAVWLQRAFARRATHTVEWPTGHSPFLSDPELVVDLLGTLADLADLSAHG